MRVRHLDETGDLSINGQTFIYDQNCIRQTIETRLRLFLGEYFRDINDGTPWFQRILGKNTNLNAIEAILRNRIVRTTGVVRLISFNLDYDENTRSLSVSGSALTEFGLLDYEVNNGGIN